MATRKRLIDQDYGDSVTVLTETTGSVALMRVKSKFSTGIVALTEAERRELAGYLLEGLD